MHSAGSTRVEKLFVPRSKLDSRTSLVRIITSKIDKLQSRIPERLVIEYLDDEGDYCILRDDHKSFMEMLQSAKTTIDQEYCRINIKVKESDSPVAAPKKDTRLARQKSTKCPKTPVENVRVQHKAQSRKQLNFSPLDSYLSSQRNEIQAQAAKVQKLNMIIEDFKSQRTASSTSTSPQTPCCSKCHLREGHNRLNCPYPVACTSAIFCKNIEKHSEEKAHLKSYAKDLNEERRKLIKMEEQLNIKETSAINVASRYPNKVKDVLIASNPDKYTRMTTNGVRIEDWRQINADSKILEKHFRGKIPSPEEAREILQSVPLVTPMATGKTTVHKPYKSLWESNGITWPKPQNSRSREECDSDDHFDTSPVKSPLRKKYIPSTPTSTAFQNPASKPEDFQIAFAIQESLKTLPSDFDLEGFERRVKDEKAECSAAIETATGCDVTGSSMNLDTLASAVEFMEKLSED